MRIAFVASFALLLSAGTATAVDVSRPGLVLSSEGTRDARADYAAISLRLGALDLSFGRPKSALDDSAFTGAGLFLAHPRSLAGAAALDNQLGAGILIRGEPVMGLSLTSSVHDGRETEDTFVAITGRYEAPEFDPLGVIAVYGGAENGGDTDVFRLGSSLTRGVASAGIDVTTEASPSQRRITGLYVGLDVTETFSVAISREVERDRSGEDLAPRLGMGASYNFGDRQVISGAIGDVTGDAPTFGLMLGLEF